VSRMTDLMAIEYIARSHCADPACQKCTARFRWLRRKGWRAGKAATRTNKERK
jgi:hypothetical protein